MYFSTDAQAIEISAAATTMPIYLFAGQSNMQGNIDPDLFNTLIKILKSNQSHKQKALTNALNNWYLHYDDGYAKYAYAPKVSALEANQLIAMQNSKFIDAKFPNPPQNNTAFCTATNDPATPVATNCGNPYGPELMFSRVFAKNNKDPFAVVKVVQGGTSLAVDWISPSASGGHPGPMYKQLSARIASLKSAPASIYPSCATGNNACKFQAFVWFQGENDCFEQKDADAYASNLKHFIADVRAAIGDPNFPVVIVQVGYWPNTLPYGPTVLKAQADFVQNTPNTTLVTTVDLSQYFHFDPAAQLIIGERIAEGVKKVAPRP